MERFIIIQFLTIVAFCRGQSDLELTYEIAQDLASLPLGCYNKLYPFKFNNVWDSAAEVAEHQNYIPIFSGCFDWHSSVHGHWLLASLLNRYPDSELGQRIIEVFDQQFQVLVVPGRMLLVFLFQNTYLFIFQFRSKGGEGGCRTRMVPKSQQL